MSIFSNRQVYLFIFSFSLIVGPALSSTRISLNEQRTQGDNKIQLDMQDIGSKDKSSSSVIKFGAAAGFGGVTLASLFAFLYFDPLKLRDNSTPPQMPDQRSTPQSTTTPTPNPSSTPLPELRVAGNDGTLNDGEPNDETMLKEEYFFNVGTYEDEVRMHNRRLKFYATCCLWGDFNPAARFTPEMCAVSMFVFLNLNPGIPSEREISDRLYGSINVAYNHNPIEKAAAVPSLEFMNTYIMDAINYA